MEKGFWRRRWEAFLDNFIFWGAGAILAAVIAAGFFGSDVTSLPLWVLVLFGGAQIGTLIAVVLMYRRLRAQRESAPAMPAKHEHAALLARIRAFNGTLSDLDLQDAIERQIAETFNRLLKDAQLATRDPVLLDMAAYQVDPDGLYAESGQLGGLRLQLEQMEAIVQHSE